MPKSDSLIDIYDYPSDITPFLRSQTEAAISIGGICLILRPYEWSSDEASLVWPEGSEKTVRSWLSIKPGSEAVASLGTLLTWSSRRPNEKITRYIFDGEADAQVPHTTRSIQRPQRVNGYPFDRGLIREALQTFVETDCPSDLGFTLKLLPMDNGHILSIAGHGITAFIASLSLDTECGTDPMPCEWTNLNAKEIG
jgi:hypothetical protein